MSGADEEADAMDRLQRTLGQVLGSDLAAHLDRDAVLWVGAELDLTVAGLAIARDNTHAVTAWLAMGALRRPTAEEREAWKAAPERAWRAIVVQPFVLVQSLD